MVYNNIGEDMKKRKLKSSSFIYLFVFCLIVFFAIYIIKNKEGNIDVSNNIDITPEQIVYLKNEEDNLNIKKDIKSLVTNYMDLYYKSISELNTYDMKDLFSDYEQAYINETAIDLLVQSRKLKPMDFKISNAKYDIIYTSYEEDDGVYKVSFLENGYYNFNFMKDIDTKLYEVENEMVIEKINDEYKIKSFDKVQDFYVMITNMYEVGNQDKEVIKSKLDKIKNNYLVDIENELDDLSDDLENLSNYKIKKTYDHEYNRAKALEYAKKYVTKRNNEYFDFGEVGGNCMNYASQVISSGGIPMDSNGSIELQWKYYDDSVSYDEEESGRTSSWTGTTNFYEYAKNNTGSGLVSQVNANYYSAEIGDIAQVGYNNNYNHTVVVIGNIKDEFGNIIDILINSNTIDQENYPLQGYIYPNKRIIRILGYND